MVLKLVKFGRSMRIKGLFMIFAFAFCVLLSFGKLVHSKRSFSRNSAVEVTSWKTCFVWWNSLKVPNTAE